MATMLSFFLPGTGQIYSGEHVKGGGLLALSTAGMVLAGRALSCSAAADCEPSTGGMALGAAGTLAFFGSWIYGIVDAGDSARRFNLRNGIAAAEVSPMVGPGVGGQTRLGLSMPLPR